MRGREIVVLGRLFLSGCKFARIDKVLHSRCYHARRNVRNLEQNCKDELTCQEIIFSDPRCPADVLNLRPLANAVINVMWSNVAFTQNETEAGRKFLWDIAQTNPVAFFGTPSPYMNFLMGYCVDDESYDYEELLDQILFQLPPQVPDVLSNYLWAISRGSFIRGVRALIWGRPEDAKRYFARVHELNFEVDEEAVQQVTHELFGYELCCGPQAAIQMLSKLASTLEIVSGKQSASWLKGSYFLNKAKQDSLESKTGIAPSTIFGAIAGHPRYLLNRGMLSTLIKAMAGTSSAVGG
jgi:hypothetical protein